ncbi:hypothetical protein AURDEDRAFT_179352 [Auricularia subglabra TFB-10046 SS5]|nr:hypothetical protein AURDEDRAFT_179352 [Auricularia subglabra TFB-10046 SS5]
MAVATGSVRSPRAARRKTVTGTSEIAPHLQHAKKRAYSLAPGAIKPIVPLRGILKPRNTDFGAGDNTRSTESSTAEFMTAIQDGTASRKSLGFNRRVSFAAHAHVRTFETDKREYAGNNSSSSPTPSPESNRQPPHDDPEDTGSEDSDEPAPDGTAPSPEHTGSLPRRRSSPLHDPDAHSEGEASMELDDEEAYTEAVGAPTANDVNDDDDDDDNDDMSLDDTGVYGDGILARRRSSVATTNRRSSMGARRRSSVAPRVSNAGTDSMEFTIALGQTLYKTRPPSATMLELQNATHSGSIVHVQDPDNSLLNLNDGTPILGGLAVNQSQDMSFSSTEESSVDMDGGGDDNKTLNLTAVLNGTSGRRSSVRASTGSAMSLDSVAPSAPIVTSTPERIPAPAAASTPAKSPARVTSILRPVSPATPRRSMSPNKPASAAKPKFTAAFAPRYAPSASTSAPSPATRKRAASVSASDMGSPAKRLAVGDVVPSPAPAPARGVSAPPTDSPSKTKRAPVRRTSSFYKSSTATGTESENIPPPASAPPKETPVSGIFTPRPTLNARENVQHPGSTTPLALPMSSSRLSSTPLVPPPTNRQSTTPLAPPPVSAQSTTPLAPPPASTITGPRASRVIAPPQPSSSPTPALPSNMYEPSSSPVAAPLYPNLDEFRPRALSTIQEMPTPTATVSTGRMYPPLDAEESPARCVREAYRQSIASPTPSRGSPAGLADKLARLSTSDPVQHAQEWIEGVQVEQDGAQMEEEPMTMEDFFEATGVRFMEELMCPRYSTALGLTGMPTENDDQEHSLQQYFKALAVDFLQLKTYQWATTYLEQWIASSKENFKGVEEEVILRPPELFYEFAMADEEHQAAILRQLKLLKTHALARAKAEWYAWKIEWVDDMQRKAEQSLLDLDEDERTLQECSEKIESGLQDLLSARDRIMQELAQERATVAEIETCDQDYLAELKAEIDEQNAEIDRQKNELVDQEATVSEMMEKLEDQERERREILGAIEDAARQSEHHRGCTREGVQVQLEELEALQGMQGWRVLRLSPSFVELAFAERFVLRVPCRDWDALPDGLCLELLDKAHASGKLPGLGIRKTCGLPPRKDRFAGATKVMLNVAQRTVAQRVNMHRRYSYVQVVRYVDSMLHAFACVRRELDLLVVHFPSYTSALDNGRGLRVTASVLVDKMESKALVSFLFDDDALMRWPVSANKVDVHVEIDYGDIQADDVQMAVRDRLVQSQVTDHHGHLLESCLEAVARYD